MYISVCDVLSALSDVGYDVPQIIEGTKYYRPANYIIMKFYCIVKTNSVFLVTGIDFSFLKIMFNNFLF